MNKAQTKALARTAYAAACEVVPGEYAERAHAVALEGERRYRRVEFGRHHPGASSADDCAQLFVARWIAEYAISRNFPAPAALHRLRHDALMCAGIAAEYGPAILAAWDAKELDSAQIAALDYVQLIGPAGR